MTRARVIAVTGTPGVGKTTLCRHATRESGYGYIEIGELVRKQHIYRSYDRGREAYVADMGRLKKAIAKLVRERGDRVVLLDGSFSHHVVPKESKAGIFLMRLEPSQLYRRLQRRYGAKKAKDNSIAEFIGLISSELKDRTHVFEIDSTGKTICQLSRALRRFIETGFVGSRPSIDWTLKMKEEEIRRFLELGKDSVSSS